MTTFEDPPSGTTARETALACLGAGIDAAKPAQTVADNLSLDDGVLTIDDATYDLDSYDEVIVVGGGKAAEGVAEALADLLGEAVSDGVVVTDDPTVDSHGPIEVLAGDHPTPSVRGVDATSQLLERVAAADEDTLVLAVITGGGSALMPAPREGVTLDELQRVTEALLESGATIDEINAVRKHCSALKGGHLAAIAAPATVVGLLWSDVTDDDVSVIASGPTAPDETTFDDALEVLDRYDVDVPAGIREVLDAGAAGESEETPGPDDAVFETVENHVLANARTAIDAARDVAETEGYETLVLSSRIYGEAREAAKTQVAIAAESLDTGDPVAPPAVVLSGGETTVTVRGDGTGGPNQEFALSGAIDLPEETVLAAVDTDGKDGSTDAAGALVDSETVTDTDRAREALADNDAYSYLDEQGSLLVCGTTGTNVNDLRVLVIGETA
jgi:hydroxypyruvate reductase